MKNLFVVVLLILVSSCSQKQRIKNVIILIGDGMGPQQVGLLTQYAKLAPQSIYAGKKTAFERAMEEGTFSLSLTHPGDGLVTDSAASATQFSGGEAAGAEMLGSNISGNPTRTILEVAKSQGKLVGLVSDTKITHATPAAFAAKSYHRSKESDIALQLAAGKVDVMLSGGTAYWLPQEVNDEYSAPYMEYKKRIAGAYPLKSKRKDSKDVVKLIEEKGYQTVFNADQLVGVKEGKLLGLFSVSYMPDAIAAPHERHKGVPTLLEMTKKSIELLEKSPKGFFLMVEGGQIDFAGHRNDIGQMLHEMIKFDGVIDYVLSWARGRKDTVVVISADHETGNPGFSYMRYNIPGPKKVEGELFKGKMHQPEYNFGNHKIFDRIFSQKMSYEDLFEELNQKGKTPENLMKLVSDQIGYQLTPAEAKRVLELEPNSYYLKGHPKLYVKEFPRVNDYKEFYVDPIKTPPALLARVLGRYQNVVWSTGAHTATPVPFIILGPKKVRKQFRGLLHTTIWGRKLIELIQ